MVGSLEDFFGAVDISRAVREVWRHKHLNLSRRGRRGTHGGWSGAIGQGARSGRFARPLNIGRLSRYHGLAAVVRKNGSRTKRTPADLHRGDDVRDGD